MPAFRPAALATLVASAASLPLHADKPQDWVPAEISLPADMEIILDRAIGSSTRIFSFSTAQDAGALIDTWSEALRAVGYTIAEPSAAIEVDQIEFSGFHIDNAKISAVPSAHETRSVIQFDASLTR